MAQKMLDNSHNIVPNLDQKTGGLFDEDQASDKFHVTGNDPASDLLSVIDNGSDILSLNNFNPLFGEMDPFAEASLDSFVDLSAYLMEESIPVADVTPDTVSVDDGTSATNKRKWHDVEEVVEIDTNPVLTTTPDHAYSAKKPRLTSAPDAYDTDQSSEASCSTPNKYRVRREKNNIASKRSREIRKNKFTEMEDKANLLVVENEKMREKIVELEALAKEMKAVLVARLSGK
ncbi:hypothetical protein SNE40_009001 [Patella caerulea]|uniref:BZIP domain-containing protein n=1 Tax=Patella caerulea TaxID=87958 RepID=A0AAN8Q2G9_PATCE